MIMQRERCKPCTAKHWSSDCNPGLVRGNWLFSILLWSNMCFVMWV